MPELKPFSIEQGRKTLIDNSPESNTDGSEHQEYVPQTEAELLAALRFKQKANAEHIRTLLTGTVETLAPWDELGLLTQARKMDSYTVGVVNDILMRVTEYRHSPNPRTVKELIAVTVEHVNSSGESLRADHYAVEGELALAVAATLKPLEDGAAQARKERQARLDMIHAKEEAPIERHEKELTRLRKMGLA
ncbi:hypothetical protein MSG34_19465 [Vibrio sp. 1CM2L]|uniref:hypothetical protein n=1 Tax=Vibrio sp. 1CM2L TaxID=2929166 RepID=UPI0020BE19A8|nr:hypothetical protein [Vibrio sp. 1CM2L]MCK8078342.1 hypothetical protein [Vibrio sp. 1CM2L]